MAAAQTNQLEGNIKGGIGQLNIAKDNNNPVFAGQIESLIEIFEEYQDDLDSLM